MKAILLLALSTIILFQSYGFVYAETSVDRAGGLDLEPDQPILTVETNASTYEEGDMITVSGSVTDYNESDPYKNFDVTLRLLAPNNNIISISQIPLNNDGSYSTFIPAQGPLWKSDGDYTISVTHGSDRNASTTFAFVLAEAEEVIEEVIESEEVIEEVIEISEEELSVGCGPGTHLVDGVCILDETTESISVSTGSSPTTGFSSWVYSISFTVLIAFAIMIILYLISRASKNKIANS